MKKTVKLSESKFRNIVSESVKKALKESQSNQEQIENMYFNLARNFGYDDFVMKMWNLYFSKNPNAAEQMLNALNVYNFPSYGE